MSDPSASTVVIVGLAHDLPRRRSIVSLRWADDPERDLALPVPFGCSLDHIREEKEKASRALSVEVAALRVGS